MVSFDHISHRWLLAHIPMDTVILEKWLRCGFIENANWFATEAGTPQGGIVSPTLANLTLDGLEVLLMKRCKRPVNPFRSFPCGFHRLYSVTSKYDMDCGILIRGDDDIGG